jgi:hypothetical protein
VRLLIIVQGKITKCRATWEKNEVHGGNAERIAICENYEVSVSVYFVPEDQFTQPLCYSGSDL